MSKADFIVFVDVDDTLVRSIGEKRIPVPRVVARVRELRNAGATLYCWNSGGAEYAQRCALEVGIADCFAAFLPKPHVIVDDQEPDEWKYCRVVRPLNHPQCTRRQASTRSRRSGHHYACRGS